MRNAQEKGSEPGAETHVATSSPSVLRRRTAREWEHIMRVLSDYLSLTARRLGIYRRTLKRRIRKFAPV